MKQMKYKKQIQLIAAIVTLIVFPVITFYLMEAYTHNPFEEVRPWAQFFNILLFELLAWIFVSVTGKIQSGLRIELVTAMIYGIANAYVVRFLDQSDRAMGYFFLEDGGKCGVQL